MFSFKKSSRGLLPLSQDSEEKDSASEQSSMLDEEYLERTTPSKSWRLWTSNVPWILTTVALSLYILFFTPSAKKNDVAWSPTDASKLTL
jgi:hypothetical protein